MRKEAEAGNALRLLAEDVGVPNRLIMDNANAMTGLNTTFQKTSRHLCIKTSTIEAHTPHQNPQERQIRELRWLSRDKRRKKNIPFRLWDFVL
eukprot:13888936-Ditylum_brightwellii.AAC.1